MLKHFKKAAMAGAVALAFASVTQAVVITNGTITADVNMSGTFKALSHMGTEYIDFPAPGNIPMSYYWLNSSQAGSPFVANNATSTNPLGAITFGAGTFSITSSAGFF